MAKMAMTGASRDGDSEESSNSSQTTPTIAPIVLLENSSLQITSHKLNGKNFLHALFKW